jgi:hypothetical protein
MQNLLLKNLNLGGIADSDYSGIANSMAEVVGLDIHNIPGLVRVNQALKKESGSTVDNAVSRILPCSDGNTYLFDLTAGKIWKRTSGGTYSLERTNTQGAILDAYEYEGYIYYSSATRLGRWEIGTAWSTADDDWDVLSSASKHPMLVKNLVLYIGNGSSVAQVDASTGTHIFIADALDLESKFTITALGEIEEDLLIGAKTTNQVNLVKIFRWDTFSISWRVDDTVPGNEIYAFIPGDNYVICCAGSKGNLYTYNGSQLEQFKRIKGDWSGSKSAFVHPNAVVNIEGTPLFGLSNLSGNPTHMGVYSFGGFAANYPKVLNLEYVISQLSLVGIEITAMALVQNNLLVAWKEGSVYGVDSFDLTVKNVGSFFTTRVIDLGRGEGKSISVSIFYKTLNGGSFVLQRKINDGSFVTLELTNDTTRNLLYTKERVEDANFVQFKLTFVKSGDSDNLCPEFEGMEINIV